MPVGTTIEQSRWEWNQGSLPPEFIPSKDCQALEDEVEFTPETLGPKGQSRQVGFGAYQRL